MSENLRILVVDDDKDFCENVKDVLELKEYQVTIAHEGSRAVDLVKQNGFDLVLMDVRMPRMDGIKAFRKIKEISAAIPVIMITAYAAEDLIKEALREGAFGCLRKPLDFDRLLQLIESALPDGLLVLVVDDEKDFCANMKDSLSDEGYRVCVAYDGSTALERTRQEDFDIIILDMKLPPLNGLETYLSIRDIRPHVVVIIITAYMPEMSKIVQQALEKSAYALLTKPVDMDRLFRLLKEVKRGRVREE